MLILVSVKPAGYMHDSHSQCGYNDAMFGKKQQFDEDGYFDTGLQVSEVDPGLLIKIKVKSQNTIVTSLDGKIYAFSDSCPHGASSLAKGSLSRHKISCPEHGYCFDVRSGNIISPEDEFYRLELYQVKLVNGYIWLKAAKPQGRR